MRKNVLFKISAYLLSAAVFAGGGAWINATFGGTANTGVLPESAGGTGVTNYSAALALKAPLASPALTGTPTAPTAVTSTESTQLATTGFVKNAMRSAGTSFSLTSANEVVLGTVYGGSSTGYFEVFQFDADFMIGSTMYHTTFSSRSTIQGTTAGSSVASTASVSPALPSGYSLQVGLFYRGGSWSTGCYYPLTLRYNSSATVYTFGSSNVYLRAEGGANTSLGTYGVGTSFIRTSRHTTTNSITWV